ncbi:hypothetical protein [Photobacterium lipolyticum]|uniref:PilZ domain-containing protein n=1 Tax=Photobacterium lipolyticum TaxID=266810 RepID=A0A2T3MWS5_9GAMM|nr:hypothetical protein [Photobacterium lipolyticum]PSW04420.1 hypothetical protein C9I89_13950 [Photobacterium lipolyticum]
MSLVKVQSKALKRLFEPVHSFRTNLSYTLNNGGLAARIRKHAIYTDSNLYDVGARVSVVRLSKKSMILDSAIPMDVSASYELSLQGIPLLDGYLTEQCSSAISRGLFCYEFHQNNWLTDKELTFLVSDII